MGVLHCKFQFKHIFKVVSERIFLVSYQSRFSKLTDEYWNLLDYISNAIDFINENGGFTIIGWYKRGVINDQSIITENIVQGGNNGISNNTSTDNQIDNGEMNYHPYFIKPTDMQLLD